MANVYELDDKTGESWGVKRDSTIMSKGEKGIQGEELGLMLKSVRLFPVVG